MFKKLFKISALIVCVACSLFVFAGCNSGLKGGPALNDYVYGNGGLAVVKGDYVYYVNGYKSYSSITSANDNKQGSVKYSSIYRTKLENGKLAYTYNELDTEQKYSHTLTKTEQVVSKVAGHESAGIYIFDNYLYYSSPNTDKDNSGTVKNEYLDFYRCKLDGTGNTHLFKTQAYSSNQSYTFSKIGNTVYLICYDGTNLNIVNTANKSKNKVSDAVTSVAFNKQTNYFATSHSVSEMEKEVYYVCANEDKKASGNVLAKVNIQTGDKTTIDSSNSNTYTLHGMGNDRVVYSKKSSLNNGSNEVLYAYNGTTETELYSNLFDSIVVIDNNSTAFEGFIGATDKALYHISASGNAVQLLSEKVTVLSVVNNCVYFLNEDSEIIKIEISNPQSQIIVSGEVEVDTTNTKYMSVASSYAFFFTSYESDNGTSYYLNMVNTYASDNNVCAPSFIGLFKAEDKPTETYDEE